MLTVFLVAVTAITAGVGHGRVRGMLKLRQRGGSIEKSREGKNMVKEKKEMQRWFSELPGWQQRQAAMQQY